ncbi:hypothetical protein DAPPUDRAFT_310279 [Daphnia pulex]|uniref:Uncharacterized protein n=1 Tax=Daphnia pulex TaxID=6669 RepID=E9FT34_DAPPU|nr:hypothetical protein DAPPUDRAFT_310279 [Daphnia pulex]|eukprot:EFX89714.1 hypothetical protein DAPPUDRAFT_310279 [Daphnia pulex]
MNDRIITISNESMQSHSTPTESQPHEISTSITINATDEQTSPEGLHQQQRLFEPPFPPPATIIARVDSHQPPPSYEEINDPNAPPPSYDSLFGRVREVRKTSRGFVDFIKNLFFFLLGKIGLMIVIGVTILIPICMLVVGAVYFNDCPAESHIPIYLIVGGACGLLKQFLSLRVRSQQSQQADLEVPDSSLTASVQSLINSFLICWFITGCYWVYHVYEPNYYDQSDSKYCSHVLFSFTFWLLTSTYIFVGVVIILLCCISSTALVLTRNR